MSFQYLPNSSPTAPRSTSRLRSVSNDFLSADLPDQTEVKRGAASNNGSDRTDDSEKRHIWEEGRKRDSAEYERISTSSSLTASLLPSPSGLDIYSLDQARGEMTIRDDLSYVAWHVLRTQFDEIIAEHPQPWHSCMKHRERRSIISDSFFFRVGNTSPLAKSLKSARWVTSLLKEGMTPILAKNGTVLRRPDVCELTAIFGNLNKTSKDIKVASQEHLHPNFCLLATLAVQVISDYSNFEMEDVSSIWSLKFDSHAITPAEAYPPTFDRLDFYREKMGCSIVQEKVEAAHDQRLQECFFQVGKLRKIYNDNMVQIDVACEKESASSSSEMWIELWRLGVSEQSG